MSPDARIMFSQPVGTEGLPGFPDALAEVAEARRIVEAVRLPVARSCPAWVEVANRLTLAQATRNPAHAEAARLALALAVAGDRRASRRPWAMAA
ncbi:MAG: hypothetical protein INR70_19640 [Parafilimonas terrae]|nr:hypothetical protein [Parafilimonas terrae]